MHYLIRYRAITALVLLSLMLVGCESRKAGSRYGEMDKYRPDAEELMEEYTPRDDGRPLTPDELHAFMTLGEIDRNMSLSESNIVEQHFKYFVHEKRDTFQRFFNRTARFQPYIHQVFRERGIPQELVAMAMAESGGNPNAYSHAGAVGLWQFMPATGRKYGLRQNAWIDERRDPFKATHAAADYLLKLYGDFKDWHLAIAAYNAGEGKIGRAIERSGKNNFFDLCDVGATLDEKTRLRQETTIYVPRIIALAKIKRNINRLGFIQPPASTAYNLSPVSVPPGTNLSAFASALAIPWEEFSGMNPAYRRTVSPIGFETTAYVLPEQVATATTWLASAESRANTDWKEHTVRRGDTLSGIAKRYGVTQRAIREANNISKLPKVGTVLMISSQTTAVSKGSSSGASASSRGTYVVKSGDTLFGLAQQWGTNGESIRLANKMGKSTSLRIGQRLTIPGNSSKVAPPKAPSSFAPVAAKVPAGATVYTVVAGDTLGGIASRAGISVNDLCRYNGITTKTKLRIGQKLQLRSAGAVSRVEPAPAAQANSSPSTSIKTATVRTGDTLYSIAKEHNTTVDKLRQANGLGQSSAIKLGQKIRIP